MRLPVLAVSIAVLCGAFVAEPAAAEPRAERGGGWKEHRKEGKEQKESNERHARDHQRPGRGHVEDSGHDQRDGRKGHKERGARGDRKVRGPGQKTRPGRGPKWAQQERASERRAAEIVRERHGGRVLSVEPDEEGYRVKVLRDGEVRILIVVDED